jgi:hypothetical protein
MTWTPPPDGTKPEPDWPADNLPYCSNWCLWRHQGKRGWCMHPNCEGRVYPWCTPAITEMRRMARESSADLAMVKQDRDSWASEAKCARARAEAWHKVAKQWKAQCGGVARMLKIVTLADERELDCARRRAEAWHKAAKRWKDVAWVGAEFVADAEAALRDAVAGLRRQRDGRQ